MKDSADIVKFFAKHRTKTFLKNELIAQPSSLLDTVLMVKSGLVKTYDIDDRGNERTVSVHSRFHILPMSWLLEVQPDATSYFYQAFTDVTCWVVSLEDVRDFLSTEQAACLGLLDIMAKANINYAARIQKLEYSGIRERVEYILYYLALCVGIIDERNVAKIDSGITMQDIASLTGLARESVSLELSKHKVSKIFWKTGQNSFIDMNKIDAQLMPHIYAI
jgi:CRP/FNR family transcriptional regulator